MAGSPRHLASPFRPGCHPTTCQDAIRGFAFTLAAASVARSRQSHGPVRDAVTLGTNMGTGITAGLTPEEQQRVGGVIRSRTDPATVDRLPMRNFSIVPMRRSRRQ